MRLEVYERGAERAASRFTRMQRRFQNPEPGFREVADFYRDRMRRRFASMGDGTWAPDAAETVRRKGSARPWIDSGKTMRSVTARGAPGSVEKMTKTSMRFGTSIFYARFASRRRPLFNVTKADRRQVVSRFTRYLLEG
jgi:hypothetical protein